MDETQGMLWLDPFNEGVWLSVGDCQRLVQNTAGVEPRDFQMSWLQATAVEEILSRMLNNLRLIYLQRQEWQPARQCVRFLHRLQPTASELWRDEGLIELQMGNFAKAVSLFEQYLQETPEAEDKVIIQQQLAPTVQKWALLN
jgi:regulator of sirC expression with transglutaminase-like and TPR domain